MLAKCIRTTWLLLARHIFFRQRRDARYVLVMGAPGSGKGTHASRLAPHLGLPHLNMGDVFRREIAEKTEVGRQVEAIVASGRLVPDAITNSLLVRELSKPAYHRGAVLDGIPRTLEQAKLLDKLLFRWGNQVGKVILLEVPKPDLIDRLQRRGRADDVPHVIEERLRVYGEEFKPLRDYYQATGLLVTVNSTNAMTKDQVFADVVSAL